MSYRDLKGPSMAPLYIALFFVVIYILLMLTVVNAAPTCQVGKKDGYFEGLIYSNESGTPNMQIHMKIPLLKDLTVLMRKQTAIKNLDHIELEVGVKRFKIDADIITFEPDLNATKHSVALIFKTEVNKKYVLHLKVDKPLWIWFGDGSRSVNPAKIKGGGGKIINFDPFTAKNTETTLFLQPQQVGEIKINEISITLVDK